jgi:hypothetical protein
MTWVARLAPGRCQTNNSDFGGPVTIAYVIGQDTLAFGTASA